MSIKGARRYVIASRRQLRAEMKVMRDAAEMEHGADGFSDPRKRTVTAFSPLDWDGTELTSVDVRPQRRRYCSE